MTFQIRFIPELEHDVIAGSVWYESKARDLGEEFTRLFYLCASEISCDPFIYQKVFGEFRRCLLRRFPYAIYYKVVGNEVVVFGFFHCIRDPRKISQHLQGRNASGNPVHTDDVKQ